MPVSTVYSILLKKENAHDDPIYCSSWINYKTRSESKNVSIDFIATGGLDGLVKIWTLKEDSLHLLHTLEGHTMAVVSVAFSPDVQIIASTSLDSSFILWDVNSGKKFKEIQTNATGIWKVAFSPQGDKIATGGHNGRIFIYNVADVSVDRILDTRGKFVMSIAWSGDGKFIATGSSDGVLCVMDVAQSKLLHTIEAHAQPVRSVTISPTNKQIATTSNDGFVKIYDVASAGLQGAMNHKCWALNVCFSSDGLRVATAAADGCVRVALVKGLRVLNKFQEHTDMVWEVQFNAVGNKLLSVSKDKSINVYECPPPPKYEKKRTATLVK